MSDRSKKYHELRNKYKEFIFNNYSYSIEASTVKVSFAFEIKGLAAFTPEWVFELPNSLSGYDLDIVDRLVFNLGMAELVSYWKISCAPVIKISASGLSFAQIEWWKKLYRKGLGEFFYTNGIDIEEDFVDIICEINEENSANANALCSQKISTKTTRPKTLIPIGGGKDSAVTMELLKNFADRYCYIINPRAATTDTIKAAKIDSSKCIYARRSLDGHMLKLNRQGFLNGHTPFSAIVAFSSVLAAYLSGIPYIALSNESSANEATVAKSDVNHQYSKSVEFEKDFIEYEAAYIKSDVKYFSLLRPYNEIKIAQLFSRFTAYHRVFKSCNAGSKQDIWCGQCAKCLFVYIILSPFLPADRLMEIFGKNLLDDMNLVTDFQKLTGVIPEKPFECVGSIDEVNAALRETIRQYADGKKDMPKLLRLYQKNYDQNSAADELTRFLTAFDEKNYVPASFMPVYSSIERA